MSELKSHFVFGTTAAYSHVPPIIELSIALLTNTPDLCISILLHINNLENAQNIISNTNEHVAEDVKARIKLYPVGEKRNWNDDVNCFFDMIYKSGEVYAGILLGSAPWPHPTVFIYDAASFFYITIKSKVEENFPHLKPTKVVGYGPLPMGELLFLGGSEENGSLRWLDGILDEFDPDAKVKPEQNVLTGANNDQSIDVEAQAAWMTKFAKAYRACFFESDRIVKIPGYTPFHVFERWGVDIDYSSLKEIGWFQYISGFQACLTIPESWSTCYPSSVLEPETFKAFEKDEFFTSKGAKQILELGWYERKPKAKENWGKDVIEFLDGQEEKSVVYISFGTLVEAGPTLPALFDLLESTKTPFIYACGNQKQSLPSHILETLESSEEQGLCISPDWVDQVGILSHGSVSCFISHCGANSTVEALEASVPVIVLLGKEGDQILLGSRIHDLGIGIELLQHRNGYSIGKQVAHREGITIHGTQSALKTELAEAFERINGTEGEEMRKKAREMKVKMDHKRSGEWLENVKEFGLYGRE